MTMIAVKGMKMPKNCMECLLFDDEYGDCNIMGEPKANMTEERARNCPLVGIVTCEHCNNHGNDKEHPDIDGARYCSALHTYTGYDFYCGDAERKE